jgi:hypothetical protein
MANQMDTAGRAVAAVGSADPGARYLWALHAVLRNHGVESDVITSGYRPRLRLHLSGEDLHPDDAGFEDNVLAANDVNGHWSFWWPWVEEMCAADDPEKAAAIILAPLEEDDSGNGDTPAKACVLPGNDGEVLTQKSTQDGRR